MVHVPHIECQLLIPRYCVTPVNLSPTSDPRPNFVKTRVLGRIQRQYSFKSALGPTRLISPLKTFQSSGSSSILALRSQLPNGVSLSESGNKLPVQSRSSVIVLNLNLTIGLPWSPGRVWRKST